MKKYLILSLLILSNQVLSYVDLNLSYTRSINKIPGVETELNPEPGAALSTTDGYVLNWAWYMWEYTALELNYSRTSQRLQDDREVTTTSGADVIIIKEQDSTVITEVSGVGIRQSFANRTAAIIPSLSIGYAKYTTSGSIKYKLDLIWNKRKDLKAKHNKIIFIGSGTTASLKMFKAYLNVQDALIYTDPTLQTFEACGLLNGFKYLMNPRSLRKIFELKKQGHENQVTDIGSGSHKQMGGVVAFKDPGVVLYHFASEYLGDEDNPDNWP
jgi:hypothetical protein